MEFDRDTIEREIRRQVRHIIEAVVEAELEAALGAKVSQLNLDLLPLLLQRLRSPVVVP